MQTQAIEEVLELIWTMREESITAKDRIIQQSKEKDVEKILTSMKRQELITIQLEQIHLTPRGEKYAQTIVRRHRLAERLFRDVFNFAPPLMELEACTWEHLLSEEVTDRVCSFLGHPRVCPHNKPIPPGDCCFKYKPVKAVTPLVQPLSAAEIGCKLRIAYILPDLLRRLDRLTTMGIFPGAVISIKQKQPAIVVACNESIIALDKKVGAEIFVISI
jgi:DtxR family transcriptional regulator, Mn-dependent transcriptional regulator